MVRRAAARVRKDSRYVPFPETRDEPQIPAKGSSGVELERALEMLPAGARAVLMIPFGIFSLLFIALALRDFSRTRKSPRIST